MSLTFHTHGRALDPADAGDGVAYVLHADDRFGGDVGGNISTVHEEELPERGRFTGATYDLTLTFTDDRAETGTTVGPTTARYELSVESIDKEGLVDEWFRVTGPPEYEGLEIDLDTDSEREEFPDWFGSEGWRGHLSVELEYSRDLTLRTTGLTPKDLEQGERGFDRTTPGVRRVWSQGEEGEFHDTVGLRDRAFDDTVAVRDGDVFVSGGDSVYRFDGGSGDVVWSCEVPGADSLLSLGEQRLYVTSSGSDVVAVDVTSGELGWRYETGDRIIAEPTHVAGSEFDGDGSGLVFIPSFDEQLHAVNADSGNREWTFELDGAGQRTTVVHGDRVFQAGMNQVYCLDTCTGTLRWERDAIGRVATPLHVASGVACYGCRSGSIEGLDAETGSPMWDLEDGPVSRDPFSVAVDGTVLASPRGGPLQALDPANGAVLTEYDLDPVSLDASSNTLYVGTRDGETAALDRDSGALRWRYDDGRAVAVQDDVVFSAGGGELFALEPTGSTQLAFDAVVETSTAASTQRFVLDGERGEYLVVSDGVPPYYVHEGAHFEVVVGLGGTRDEVTGERQRESGQVTEFDAEVVDAGGGVVTFELSPLGGADEWDGSSSVTLAADQLPAGFEVGGASGVLAVYLEYDEERTPDEAKPETHES